MTCAVVFVVSVCLIHVVEFTVATDIRQAPYFTSGEALGKVTYQRIDEASGIAASRRHPGYLYTHNDHGDGPHIYVLDTSGAHTGTLNLNGATSHDWEDIAVGKCSNGSSEYCIYIGDFGDAKPGPVDNIYRIPEPNSVTSNLDLSVSSADILQFSWDQADCETLMVDPEANIFIVSKIHGGRGTIAQLPTSSWGTNVRVQISSTAKMDFSTTHNDPVGGDISPDGTEVLIKTHHKLYYWEVLDGDYVAALQTPGTEVPYIDEPQGEAVGWDSAGNGYYCLSEGTDQKLYRYVKT